jgi:hypothetical protein
MVGFFNMTVFQPKNQLLTWNTHPIPDSALNDLWLFPKVKSALKERKFQDTADMQKMWHWH